MWFDEEELAELYYLILKHQYGLATAEDEERLVSLAKRYLQYSAELMRSWLIGHGQLGDFDDYVDMITYYEDRVADEIGSWILETIGKNLMEAGQMRMDGYAVDTDYAITQENVNCYLTIPELLKNGIRPFYECYKKNLEGWDIVKTMKGTLEKVEAYLQNPYKYSIKDLILLVDEVTDTHHNAGLLLDDYGGIDVVEAKAEAERMFDEEFGG